MNILLGLTGSVATIKAGELYTELSKNDEVKVVATEKAMHFLPNPIECAKNNKPYIPLYKIITEEQEWNWKKLGDPVQHIELAEWADILLVAPITANTISKLSNGICDNLLTCIFVAWNQKKPIIIAPAMNTRMWEHYIIQENLSNLFANYVQNYFCDIIEPIKKKLACGTVGVGAMAEISTIIKHVEHAKTWVNESAIKEIIE